MLSRIPAFSPMYANYEQPVAINPTSIETLTMQCLLSDTIAAAAPTAHNIETITMQYLQLGVAPPEVESTVFAIETIFIQYLERV